MFASFAAAAPGASRSDFGRSQSAPGALWELFEIIKSSQNRHFDALGRSWDPPGPPRASQKPKMHPKLSQTAPKIIPKWSQNCPNIIPKLFQNVPKMI